MENIHCHLESLLIGFPIADFIALYCCVPSTLSIPPTACGLLLLLLPGMSSAT